VTALVVRARGLQARLADEVARAQPASPEAAERLAREHTASELATLARWAEPGELDALELDEDRRSLRAIVRGLAAGVPAERRRLATVATSRLPERTLASLAAAASIHELFGLLAAIDHPLRDAFAGDPATIDLYAIEVALAASYARVARELAPDRAMAAYVDQVLAAEQARTDEDTALEQQLATQRRLRRTDPLGLAAVIHVVLARRADARRLRRAAWRRALGGAR
jgi:vacuolar-type H+-ATPase subunit C/Vma6